jgi:hypothetical protein
MRELTVTNLTTLVIVLALLAQVPPPVATGGGFAEGFRQYDKNGDGKVTREEAPQLPLFDQWDENKDDAVTLEEVTAFYANRPTGGRKADPPPSPPAPVKRPRPAADGFVPDAPFVGQIGGSYIDPEFSEAAGQVVFQDMQNRVWIGDIDPATGLFKTATGRDYLMDQNIVVVFDRPPQGRKFSTNGPKWMRDDKGHLVVYTKVDSAGIMQQFVSSVPRPSTQIQPRLLRFLFSRASSEKYDTLPTPVAEAIVSGDEMNG